MKILQANKFFFINGGSETVMFQERDYLLQNGHQVIDFSMQHERNLPSEHSAEFVQNKQYGAGGKLTKLSNSLSLIHSAEAIRNISHLIKKIKPDLVHCHNIYHQLTPSIIGAAKKLGVPVVLTLHDYKPVCPTYNRLQNGQPCSKCLDGDFLQVVRNKCADGSLGKSTLLYLEAIIQRLLRNYEKVDAFIAPSQFMQQAIAKRIPKHRIKQLYNGVDTNAVSASQADEGYVLYIGRLVPEKGVETLLKAHAISENKWTLKVAGTGPMLDVLKAQYSSGIFIGHLGGDKLKTTIENASVVVVPSEWYENCPMAVLEAMTYGKPVVGSRMGGIPELIEDGITGLLYEAGNVNGLAAAINKLMVSKKLRQEMGAAGRQRVTQNFSLDKHHKGLIEIYQFALGV